MAKEISSKSLSSHDEIVTNLELSAFGLMLLSDYEPKTERDKNLWQGLFSCSLICLNSTFMI